jgi:hypothetical protein
MRLIKLIFIFIGIVLMQGCATLPSPEQMQAETKDFKLPKYPSEDQAMVYVVRPSSLGGLIRFNVFLDNQQADSEVGFTRGNQYIYFSVKPGQHKILSKAENWSEWVIDVKSGDIVFIQQDAAMGLVIARNTIFKINDMEGKYHVKTLNLGTILKSNDK